MELKLMPPALYTVTKESQDLTDRILELDAQTGINELGVSFAAAFVAHVLGKSSIDTVRAHILKHGFDHPKMLPFWEDVAQDVVEAFVHEFEEYSDPCGDPECPNCGEGTSA